MSTAAQPGTGTFPVGTLVNVASMPPGQRVKGSQVTSGGYVEYRFADPKGGADVWVRSWKVRAAEPVDPSPALEGARPSAVKQGHKIVDDGQVPQSEWIARKTPSGLHAAFDDIRIRTFGNHPPQISALTYSSDAGYKKFAQIVTDIPVVTDAGVQVHITLSCNPKHMAVPHDLIPVTLELNDGKTLDSIAVAEPGKNGAGNICDFDVSYTFEQLLTVYKVTAPSGLTAPGLRAWFIQAYPHFGIKAEWLGTGAENTNRMNHFSGGAAAKGGSGKVKLRPLTEQELLACERFRISDWNLSERLRDDRPVFNKYPHVLQAGQEMATSIEAEAEYNVSQAELDTAIAKMEFLRDNPRSLGEFNILELKDGDIQTTTDTYYDTPALDLMHRWIVLRRRDVATDDPGTFLFSTKCRSVDFSGERFRLASQVHLQLDPSDPQVSRFCGDVMTDNAFARILDDGLRHSSAPTAWVQDWPLQKVVTLISKRRKFTIELANGTTVEFSADTATATHGADTRTLFCVELGVGHAGLVVGETGSSNTASMMRETLPYTRPYHVPADLDNKGLVMKPDYQQFVQLREALVFHLFGRKAAEMTLGGNKARTLATNLGILHD